MSIFRAVLIFVAVMVMNCFAEMSAAKCPSDKYNINSTVVDSSGAPVNEASISVFFDHQESGFTAYSSGTGQFSVKCLYNTFRRTSLFGDICNDAPSSLTIIVHANGYFTKMVKVKSGPIQNIEGINILEIPPVVLVKVLSKTQELLK